MPKKTSHIMILFILFPLVVGLACMASRADPTATPRPVTETEMVAEAPSAEPTSAPVVEETEKPTPTLSAPEDFVLLDNSLWIQDGSLVFAAFMIKNPSSNLLYEDVEFTIRLLDENGDLVGEDFQNTRWLFPGQTVGLVTNYWLASETEEVGAVEVDWTYAGTSTDGDWVNPITYADAVYWGNGGYPLVTGKVVNIGGTAATDVQANVICFNDAGEVVGGGYTFVDFVLGEAHMGFSAYVDTFGDVASVEVFPSLTFASQWIEAADFLSAIVIEDFHFYADDLGYLQGGFIARNTTEQVLRNSLVSINFYDENDHITAVASTYIDLLLPGDAVGIIPWVTTPPKGVESLRYEFVQLPGEVDDTYELDTNPFVINNITITGEDDDMVLVNFTNQYSKTVSEVDVYVLVYNAAGEIIGGGKDWTKSPTPPGGTSELEVWVSYDSAETVAVAEAWVVPSFFTIFE
jgi:hypothetical protein